MPDLPTALAGMFDGGDMTIFQAVVDEIGSGVVTLHANGGQFEDVPYVDHGLMEGVVFPSIGDHVYVIGRKGWGMLVLGRAAPSDRPPPGDNATYEFATAVIGDYDFGTATWTVPLSDVMEITPGAGTNKGAFYFHDIGGSLPGETVASASFLLGTGPFDTYGIGVDWAYVTLGLFQSTTDYPSAAPTLVAGMTASYRRNANDDQDGYVSIPLEWANRLLADTAIGICVLSEDYPGTVHGPGTLRLTTL